MRSIFGLSALVVAATVFGSSAGWAQSVGPDEAVQPNGAVMQKLMLTPAQKSAIYNAVFQRRTKPSAVLLSAAVGAPVPGMVGLIDLPAEAGGDNAAGADLKYAMVDHDIIIVDPVMMRVIDIIHGGVKP